MATAENFALQIAAFAARAGANADLVVRKVVLDVMTSLVMKSPVGDPDLWKDPPPPGYVGGRFRGEWQYSFNEPASALTNTIDADGMVSIGRAANINPAAGVHYLTNLMPYGRKLEYDGHSSQCPDGFVGITVREFEAIVGNAAGAVA